jgi:hypothetical protein
MDTLYESLKRFCVVQNNVVNASLSKTAQVQTVVVEDSDDTSDRWALTEPPPPSYRP